MARLFEAISERLPLVGGLCAVLRRVGAVLVEGGGCDFGGGEAGAGGLPAAVDALPWLCALGCVLAGGVFDDADEGDAPPRDEAGVDVVKDPLEAALFCGDD